MMYLPFSILCLIAWKFHACQCVVVAFLPSHEMFMVSTAPGSFHDIQKKKQATRPQMKKHDARGTKLRTVPLMQEV